MKNVVQMLEQVFRRRFVYPLFRMVWKNPRVDLPLDITAIRKILILRYDRIGDIIVTTPIFRALKQANPALFIGVLGSESNAELIRFNRNVDKIHVLRSSWWALWKEIRAARAEHYDVVLNFIFNRTTSAGVLSNLIAPKGIKIGQGAEVYRFYFNVLLHLERGSKHMVEVLGSIVREVFEIKIQPKQLSFEIAREQDATEAVTRFLGSVAEVRKRVSGKKSPRSGIKRHLIVVNISATDTVRMMTETQANTVVRSLLDMGVWNIVVIGAPADTGLRDEIVRKANDEHCHVYPSGRIASLREIAALVEKADAVITPDTSIVHVASAMETPVLGLFTPLKVNAEWFPFKVTYSMIMAPPDAPISSISEESIRLGIRGFMRKIGVKPDGQGKWSRKRAR